MFEDAKDCLFLDIETNVPDDKKFSDLGQLAIDEIRCAVLRIPEDGVNPTAYGIATKPEELMDLLELHKGKPIVGHNIFRFDAPVLKRIWGIDLVEDRDVYDTLLMSKISEFKRSSHSLDSYADEFHVYKPPLENGLRELILRCKADVKLTARLYNHLLTSKEVFEIPDNPYKVEFRVAEIIARQHAYGVNFDFYEAPKLVEHIKADMDFLSMGIHDEIGNVPLPENKKKMPPKKQFNKDGKPSALMQKYVEDHGCRFEYVERGNFYVIVDRKGAKRALPLISAIENYGPLDIGSPQAVKDYLLSMGWIPTMWNRKRGPDGKYVNTSPKLWDDNKEVCPNIAKTHARGIAKISEYLTLRNRLNVILGWIENTRVQEAGLICSDADTLGAVTGRFTHKIVANVPRATTEIGKKMRALFRPSPSKVMVGWDASSLEARMEAHYTHPFDGGEYAKELLEGDIHTKNQAALSLATRDKAKTWKYAVTYGASPKKLASTFGWTQHEAEIAYQKFWDANPALRALAAKVQTSGEKGWIRGLDGRPIPVDSKHSALNRLLQSAGAITMKYAMVIADREIRREGISAQGLIRYHDEEQWEASFYEADRVGKIGVESIRKAGRYLKLNVPLDGEYKVGSNWSETH